MIMIKGRPLCEVLWRIVERKPMISDWRKASNGMVVRFFNWRG